MENTIPPFDPASTVLHKFKFLDDDMSSNDNDSFGSGSGSNISGSNNSIPSAGISDHASVWDYSEDDVLVTGSRPPYDIDDSNNYGSPERKRRKE